MTEASRRCEPVPECPFGTANPCDGSASFTGNTGPDRAPQNTRIRWGAARILWGRRAADSCRLERSNHFAFRDRGSCNTYRASLAMSWTVSESRTRRLYVSCILSTISVDFLKLSKCDLRKSILFIMFAILLSSIYLSKK